jgi:hypothetical protein
MSRLGWNLVIVKTKHDKNTEAVKALRLAESKVKICEQVAAADQRQSHATKVKFKNAKKAWKLARKKAKRSAKLAKLANKNLATLAKHLKGMKKKAQPAKASASATSRPVKRSIRSTKPTAATIPSASLKSAAEAASNPTGDSVVS